MAANIIAQTKLMPVVDFTNPVGAFTLAFSILIGIFLIKMHQFPYTN